jgi:hypothetical protein
VTKQQQQNSSMQIVRLSTDDGQKLVGLLVFPSMVKNVLRVLSTTT